MTLLEFEQQRFTSLDGLTLVGEVGGVCHAPVVILMHGGGQTRHSWAGAMRALVARGYHVINFDARGHGDSDWSSVGAYDLEDRVDDLSCVLGDNTSNYALVGASLGGATALAAIARGMRPTAVILIDVVPEAKEAGIQRIHAFMSKTLDGFMTLEEAVDAVVAYNPDRPRPRDPTGLMRNLRTSPDGRLRWHWDPMIVVEQPETRRRKLAAYAEEVARAERLPMLLVRGVESDVVSDQGIARFRQLLPHLEVIDINAAGHMVVGDRNDAFNAGVLGFLDRHMPSGLRRKGKEHD
jgi:pimeloyl-ACP methyl ester carboxylesterase